MQRYGWALTTLLAVTVTCSKTAHADWQERFEAFCERVKTDWHRNNCWPEPFIRPDRVHVKAPLAMMVANGWREQNLLGQHHFNSDSTSLTVAGQLKVQEILNHAPPRFRTIFVQRDIDRDVTAARLDAVEQYASRILPEGTLADVQESHLHPEGRPAMVVDAINVRFQETQPVPQLPKAIHSDGL